ncbi:MAG: DUF6460 domain-containing protein [Hyphomicrobiaceae bacterium]
MDKFFGGNPLSVVVKLIVLSLVVGIVMAALGLDVFSLVESLQRLAMRLYDMGFGAIEWAFRYFLLGAAVVIPIWLVIRLLKLGGRSGERR